MNFIYSYIYIKYVVFKIINPYLPIQGVPKK